MRRYSRDNIIRGGKSFGTNRTAIKIRRAIERGILDTQVITCGHLRRLDHIAYQYLGNPSLWWIIAAASGIGWGLQVPAGTRLVIPTNVSQLETIL